MVGLIEVGKLSPLKALELVCKDDDKIMSDRQLEFIRNYKSGCGCNII